MSAPLTIRQHLMCIQAVADRIDQDWIPSRSSEALVLELRAIAAGGLALLDACLIEQTGTHANPPRQTRLRLVPDPESS